jgi:hypothetical protein
MALQGHAGPVQSPAPGGGGDGPGEGRSAGVARGCARLRCAGRGVFGRASILCATLCHQRANSVPYPCQNRGVRGGTPGHSRHSRSALSPLSRSTQGHFRARQYTPVKSGSAGLSRRQHGFKSRRGRWHCRRNGLPDCSRRPFRVAREKSIQLEDGTCCGHLADGWRRAGKRVLLVDPDQQGHASIWLRSRDPYRRLFT